MNNIESYILNGSRVWRGHLTKIGGQRLDSPAPFFIRPLNHNDAAAMGKLSNDIYRHLNPGEECFIHQHTPAYYHQVFANPDISYIGIFRGEQLIAMSNLTLCRTPRDFAAEIPASPVNFFDRPGTLIAAFGADCVKPEYRGNSLNLIMTTCRLDLAREKGCTDAASIIDRRNHWNMPPYFSNGFNMFATGIDPADGGKIALMHHDLHQPRPAQSQPGINIPYNRFDIIDRLLEKGYIGWEYNRQSAGITFTFSPEYQKRRQVLPQMAVWIQTKGAAHV